MGNESDYQAETLEFGRWLIQKFPWCRLRWAGEDIKGRCPRPTHDDRHPSFSLSITLRTWVCSCGHGKASELMEELEFAPEGSRRSSPTPSRPRPRPAMPRPHPKPSHKSGPVPDREPDDIYRYQGGNRKLKWRIPGGGKSTVRWRHEDGTWGSHGDVGIYRLALIGDAKTVHISESESDADALAGLGLTAIATPHGASSPWAGVPEALQGRKIVVWEHRDPAGEKYAEETVSIARKAGLEAVRVLSPKPHKDVRDWIKAGATRAEVEAASERALVREVVAEVPEPPSPAMPEEALGLAPEPFRRIVEFYARRTEAPPSFLLYSLATWAGALLGRTVHQPYATDLAPLFYTILVAPAGKRKTTADTLIRRAVVPGHWDPTAWGLSERRGSMGSGIALLEALAAAETDIGAGAVTLWRPPEWSAVLRAAEREGGRDIVPMLLGAYDGYKDYTHRVRTRAKDGSGGTVRLVKPGLAIVSTAQEGMLRAHLSMDTIGLGLASRMVMVYHGEPVAPVPLPERTFRRANFQPVADASAEIRNAIQWWRDRLAASTVGGQTGRDLHPDGIPVEIAEGSEAERIWCGWYTVRAAVADEAAEDPAKAPELTVRVPEQARKFALVRAALERRESLSADDINWGVVMAEFAGVSAEWIARGGGMGESRAGARERVLLSRIHEAGGRWVKLYDLRRKIHGMTSFDAMQILKACREEGGIETRETRRGAGGKASVLVACRCSTECRAG